jgi:GntR family transcriptional repressor for pyruvate dehydrogenase complex
MPGHYFRKGDNILKIIKKTVTEQIVEYILEQIRKGIYKPGNKLPSQDELSRELEVSRVSIREAMIQLQYMSLIEIHQGEGTFVSQNSLENLMSNALKITVMARANKENLIHLLEVRRIIEQHTIELAVLRGEEDELLPLEEIIKEMDTCIDPQSFLSKDLEFHLQIARASGNPILFKLLEMIRYTFWNELMDVMDIPGLREKAIEYHNLIYGAIQAGNKEKAVRFMLEHLTEPERLILERGDAVSQRDLS